MEALTHQAREGLPWEIIWCCSKTKVIVSGKNYGDISDLGVCVQGM